MLAGVPLWHPGQVLSAHSTDVLPRSLPPGGWPLLCLLDAAHAIAQDTEVPADTGRGCLPCHCAAPIPWRLACELTASPLLLVPLSRCGSSLASGCLTVVPSSPDHVGPLYGAGLRLVPSFV